MKAKISGSKIKDFNFQKVFCKEIKKEEDNIIKQDSSVFVGP